MPLCSLLLYAGYNRSMKTTEATIAEILESITFAGNVRARKMFGEYVVYCNKKVVALVCRNELFVKETYAGRAFAPELELAPAYPGAKPGIHVPRDRWEYTEWLSKLIRVTADELPAKKK